MFETMKVLKTLAALLGAFLFLLLVSWGASSLYSIAPTPHGDEEVTQAYQIEVEGGEEEEAAEEVQIDFGALLAEADPAAGEKVFGKCRSCHKLDGSDGIGPHLNGVVGREVASVAGFAYSDAMVEHRAEAPAWEPEALQVFLEDPKGVVPGTKMSFNGLRKPEDRAAVVAYLQSTQ